MASTQKKLVSTRLSSTIKPMKKTALEKAIACFPTLAAFSKEVGAESYRTVQQWHKNGVPARYCPKIERLTGVSRKLLRPDDWREYWPEMDETAEST